jgi:hypothetical protein
MLHRGRIADASRELAAWNTARQRFPSFPGQRTGSSSRGIARRAGTAFRAAEEEIAELRQLLLSGITGEESPERKLLIRYEDQWLPIKTNAGPCGAGRRGDASMHPGGMQEIEFLAADSAPVCSRDYPQAEELLNGKQPVGRAAASGRFPHRFHGGIRTVSTPVGGHPLRLQTRVLHHRAGGRLRSDLPGDCSSTIFYARTRNWPGQEKYRFCDATGNRALCRNPWPVCNNGTAGDTMVTNVHTGWPGVPWPADFPGRGDPVSANRIRSSFYAATAPEPPIAYLDPAAPRRRRDIETISARELQRKHRRILGDRTHLRAGLGQKIILGSVSFYNGAFFGYFIEYTIL